MIDRAARPPILTDERWSWISSLVACPICRGDLREGNCLECASCGAVFGSADGVLDLRGPDPKTHAFALTTGRGSYSALFDRVEKGPPAITFDGALPPRTTAEFMTLLQDLIEPGRVVIEVGGGAGRYRVPVLELGHRFVSTDYDSADTDLLADAHALPFKSESADAILIQSVSQAFENPFVAFREIARLVKPGGVVLGTADCCAVFASSFFNMTPWGTLSVLEDAGLRAERAWPTKDALEFCGTNPGYPAVMKPVLRALSRVARIPLLQPRNFLSGRQGDPFITAGSFAFVARKAT